MAISEACLAPVQLEHLGPPARIVEQATRDAAQCVTARHGVPPPPVALLDDALSRSRDPHGPARKDQAAAGDSASIRFLSIDVGVQKLLRTCTTTVELLGDAPPCVAGLDRIYEIVRLGRYQITPLRG